MLPLVAPGGMAVALKSAKVQDELKGSDKIVIRLRGSEPLVIPVFLPGSDVERYLIAVYKAR